MKKIFLILLLFGATTIYSQTTSSYFFYINGKKFVKPVKYILYNYTKDAKKTSKKRIYFYIQGEMFVFLSKKHKLDTCNIKCLKKK